MPHRPARESARSVAVGLISLGRLQQLDRAGLSVVHTEELANVTERALALTTLIAKLPDSVFKGVDDELVERVHRALRGEREAVAVVKAVAKKRRAG